MPQAAARSTFDGVRVERAAAVDVDLARAWSRAVAHWFGGAHRPVPGAERNRDVCLVESPIGRLVAKRDRHRASMLMRLGLRASRSQHAFRLGERMRACGIATPEPLAVLTSRGERGAESVLVTRWVEACGPWGFVQGDGVLPSASGSGEKSPIPSPHPPGETGAGANGFPMRHESLQRDRIQALVTSLASALAQLHACGFRHRDLKAPNILVLGPGNTAGTPLTIAWLDLDGAALRRTVSRSQRTRDLARLAASFASPPAQAAGIAPDDWDDLVHLYIQHASAQVRLAPHRLIASTRRWAATHARRNLVRGRPLT